MKIRREQIEAFDEARLPEFENTMVRHLADFSPLHSRNLGDDGIRELIRAGWDRARHYGFTKRGPVRFFIETAVLLGIDFATDPQYPWAGEILNDPTARDQVDRADELYSQVMHFVDAAGGPERQYAKEALRRARDLPLEAPSFSASSFEGELTAVLNRIHPEKIDAVGRAAVRGLIYRAVADSHRYGVATDEGICLLIGLMFAVGHGCAQDPKYPWIANTLSNPAIAGPHKRVQRLHSKTMTYLDRVLEHLGA